MGASAACYRDSFILIFQLTAQREAIESKIHFYDGNCHQTRMVSVAGSLQTFFASQD
jgi:hypothetical protein